MGDPILNSAKIGVGMAGVCYVLFFVPLCWLSAGQQNLVFLHVLFLLEVPPHIERLFREFTFPTFSLATDLPFLSALGILYGVLCLTSMLFYFSFEHNGRRISKAVHFLTTTNGFFWGYLITLHISDWFLHVTDFDISLYPVYIIKFFYLYILFIVFSFIRNHLPANRLRRTQFEMLLDGLFGIISTLIIIVGFKGGLISLLSGPIFLVMVFLAMLAAEVIFSRPYAALMYSMVKLEVDPGVERNPGERGLEFLKRFAIIYWQNFRVGITQPLEKTVYQVDEFIGRNFPEDNEGSDVFSLNKKVFLSSFLIFLIWPCIGVGIYLYVYPYLYGLIIAP